MGMLIGANLGGWFSDRVGRKRALLVTTLWYSTFSLLNACVWNPAGLFLTRLLTGAGLSAMAVVGMTYVSEMFPVKRRGSFQGWIMMIASCGIPATAFVARMVIPLGSWGWRFVFVWGALGMLVLAFLPRLEESPRWYENQGRFAEADAVLDRIEARVRAQAGELPPIPEIAPPLVHRGRYSELFSPAVRGGSPPCSSRHGSSRRSPFTGHRRGFRLCLSPKASRWCIPSPGPRPCSWARRWAPCSPDSSRTNGTASGW